MLLSRSVLRRVVAVFAIGTVAIASACGGDSSTEPIGGTDPATETFASSLGINLAAMTKRSPSLYVQDLVTGTGAAVAVGHPLVVSYTLWLSNGTQLQTNVGGTPYAFTLGVGDVIPGWDQGLVGMKVGGKRLLVIGSALGYGATGYGNVPPNSTLVFTVQVLSTQ